MAQDERSKGEGDPAVDEQGNEAAGVASFSGHYLHNLGLTTCFPFVLMSEQLTALCRQSSLTYLLEDLLTNVGHEDQIPPTCRRAYYVVLACVSPMEHTLKVCHHVPNHFASSKRLQTLSSLTGALCCFTPLGDIQLP